MHLVHCHDLLNASGSIQIDLDKMPKIEFGMANGDVKHIIVFRSEKTPMTIPENFLCNFINVETVEFVKSCNVQRINDGFLSRCRKLESLKFCNTMNVKFVGHDFLLACHNLKNIHFGKKFKPIKILNAFMSRCFDLETLDLSICLSKTVEIGDFFLYSCDELINVIMPNQSYIKSIGSHCMNFCESLININLSVFSKLNILSHAFLSDCSSLENVNLQNFCNLKKIEPRCFENCKKLKHVDFSGCSTVVEICCPFMKNCNLLKSVNFSNIEDMEIIALDFGIESGFIKDSINLHYIDFTNIKSLVYWSDNCVEHDCPNDFLTKCYNIDSIIIKNITPQLKTFFGKHSHLIKPKPLYITTYNQELLQLQTDQTHLNSVLNHFRIDYASNASHEDLLKLLANIKEEYMQLPTAQDLEQCVNEDEMFTLDKLCDIPLKKLIFLKNNIGSYHGFDVVILKNFLICQNNKFIKDNKFLNPLTMTKIFEEDIDKLLNTNVQYIKYFCE